MKLVIQRVSEASVKVEGKIVGSIDQGLLILIGITHNDTKEQVDWLVQKISKMRIFLDSDDKLNLSLLDISGSVLAISQFTLYGEAVKGNRPSFSEAARPSHAEPLYDYFISSLRDLKINTQTGIFGTDMKVSLINDGPVTIILER